MEPDAVCHAGAGHKARGCHGDPAFLIGMPAALQARGLHPCAASRTNGGAPTAATAAARQSMRGSTAVGYPSTAVV